MSAIVRARAGGSRLEILPTAPASNPSDLVGSSAMRMLLQDITGHGQSRIVILDLPPLLTGHDVISILPQVDCVLLVAAVGTSKVSEIEECNKYLQATDVVRFVLNKAPESTTGTAIIEECVRTQTPSWRTAFAARSIYRLRDDVNSLASLSSTRTAAGVRNGNSFRPDRDRTSRHRTRSQNLYVAPIMP